MARTRLRVTGTVQGVGFRPFVYRRAVDLGLAGFVRNDSEGVLIEVEGDGDRIAFLANAIESDPPPLARIASVSAEPIPEQGDTAFLIEDSTPGGVPAVPVSIDTAACAACLAEVDDPADRRHRYPFTNCTNCGPRYTIVRSVPYDRAATTMAAFRMCGACQREYDDPGDRRFHAQPNACPACGPELAYDGLRGDAALRSAIDALTDGAIVAIKGLGGYHIAVDARDGDAVAELRRRKSRDDKPFAVMVPDVDAACALCELNDEAVAELTSPRRPIVVAPAAPDHGLAAGVAPGLLELGVLLPYTPLHHLLLQGVGGPLVMTSGNLTDEPIAHEDHDAVRRLGPLVDAFLTHNRPIHIRCDDSVVRLIALTPRSRRERDQKSKGVQVLRRSRGYAPEPMRLPIPATRPILAVGAELKNTVAVAKGDGVVASHHIGDLEHLATYQSFLQAVEHLAHLYGVEPEVVAHDLHPEYLSTKYALDLDLPPLGVQHHHAHVASALVEHGRTEPVLGLAFDGTGYGCDRHLWGGEFLVADLASATRVGRLKPMILPGGGAAIREPWRMAVSWVGTRALDLDDRAPAVLDLVQAQVGPVTTSMGRLFDAVAALLDGPREVTYEAQAAIQLEMLARQVPAEDALDYAGLVDTTGDTLDPSELLAELLVLRGQDVSPRVLAAAFHQSIGRAAADLGAGLARRHGLDTVVLTGGVFQNVRLTEIVAQTLHVHGLGVLLHHDIPPNDGGISIGQAGVAAAVQQSVRNAPIYATTIAA